jgi:pimeloyl-ACP methyl ester carboxylesterase
MLLFALDPPIGLVPPMPTPQGDRMSALLTWAEGPTGGGLSVIQELLDELERPPGPSQVDESKLNPIATVEFTLDRQITEFDEAQFKLALRLATGIEASHIRIASLRSGSTIVRINGEQETLAAIIRKIQFSQQAAHQLAVDIGMRKFAWEIEGTRYELTVDRPTEDKLTVSKPVIVRTEPLESSLERQENADEKTATEKDDTNIKEVVLLAHGIRDFGEWEQKVSTILEKIPATRAPPLSYGRFDAIRFWFPIGTREAPVRKLLWRIRSARDRFSTAKLSVIAHSFGTYAIGKILRENPDIRLHRLVLCGAILPSEFRWDQIQHSVATEIINDCGIRDIWPVLAQSTTFGYGPSGRFGFGTPGVRDRFHDFGHGGFFQKKFVADFWLPWFRNGEFVKSKAPPPSGARWHLLTIIQIKWLWIILCVLAIAVLAWLSDSKNRTTAFDAALNVQQVIAALFTGQQPLRPANFTNGWKEEILGRQAENGGFRIFNDPISVAQAWTSAQCLTGFLSSSDLVAPNGKHLAACFDFLESTRTSDKQGGWGMWESSQFPVTEITAWVILAEVLSMGDEVADAIWSQEQQHTINTRIMRDLDSNKNVQDLSGGWAPIQGVPPGEVRTYSTTMALWSELTAIAVPRVKRFIGDRYKSSIYRALIWFQNNFSQDLGG